MAKPSYRLIKALRATASNLTNGSKYQWGHMGACNCGNLAQELTSLTKKEIHEYAMRGHGDWSEQVSAFCPTSSFPMDLLISELISEGLSLDDLINLERLKDKDVLKLIPSERRNNLAHNSREDVALYLSKWADYLQTKMVSKKTKKASAGGEAILA